MERSGAVNHPLPRGRAAPPGQRAVERVSRPRMPVPPRGSAVLQERPLPRAQDRAAACSLALCVETPGRPCSFRLPCRGRAQAPPAWRDFAWKGGDPRRSATPPGPSVLQRKGGPGWVSLAARKFSKLRADPPTWGESSGWPGAQPRDLSFHTLRGLGASRRFFLWNPGQCEDNFAERRARLESDAFEFLFKTVLM